MAYEFQFNAPRSGSPAHMFDGFVNVRLSPDTGGPHDLEVHVNILYHASQSYRRLVDDFQGPVRVFDIAAAGLQPWQVDFFLTLAYERAWDFDRSPKDILAPIVAALAYFDAATYVYNAADVPVNLVPHLITREPIPDPHAILDALLVVDPVRFVMPETHMACKCAMQAAALGLDARRFDLIFARRDDLALLSKDTLIDLLHLHYPLRDSTEFEMELVGTDEYTQSVCSLQLTKKEAMQRRLHMARTNRPRDFVFWLGRTWKSEPVFVTFDDVECTPGEFRHGDHAMLMNLSRDSTVGVLWLKHDGRRSMRLYYRGSFEIRTADGVVRVHAVPQWTDTVDLSTVFPGVDLSQTHTLTFRGSLRASRH